MKEVITMAIYYHCNICGNMFDAIHDGRNIPVCCGHPMTPLVPASTDGAKEKHVPVCSVENNVITIKVGENPHPMDDSHYIEWIALCTNHGYYRKLLCPGDPPLATFHLASGEHAEKIYAYCNLHGLWLAK